MATSPSSSSLNKDQLQAIQHAGGPLLIVAGAGTGKTTVITERIKWLIAQELAKPEEILALTFTEKAAREMETRVDQTLPYGLFGLWISTFHSFADRILRSEALQIGLPLNYRLMTEAETYLFIKKNFWQFDLKYFRPSGNPFKFIEGMSQHFDRLRDEDTTADQYLKLVEKIDGEEKEKFIELAKAYKTYEDLKVKEGQMDFGDLLANTLKLFRTRPGVLKKYQKQFKYILVDEFQDTNYSQYQLVKLLAPPEANPNLTVCGDDSQSIYAFRGAAISNILSFMEDYPKAKQVVLGTNYRSSQTILDSAYKLIKHNDPYTLEAKLKISKNLSAGKKLPLEPVTMLYSERVEDEAEEVVKQIKKLKKEDKSLQWKDFAILFRANNHSEPFIRAFERAKVPFQFLGPGMLFRQSEVKDLIAYLKVLYDYNDSLSLYRVLSMDLWNISGKELITLLNTAKKSNTTLFEVLEQSDDDKLKKFVDMIHRHQELVKKETAGQILFYFLEDSGLLKSVVEYKSVAEEKRASNIAKFFDKLKSFESSHEDSSIFAVVDYIDLAMSVGESPLAAEIDWTENNAVNMLTVHSAKGLEFPIVFLVNLVEGRFPSRERKETIPLPDVAIKELLPEGDYHLQEERRLFYVAATRAQQKLFYSAANFYGEGKKERKLSPFIYESLADGWEATKIENGNAKQLALFDYQVNQKEESAESKHKVDFLSYSAIETFKICPLHYKLKNILRLPTPMTSAQAMGNSIHLVLKEVLQKISDGEWKVGQKDELKKIHQLLEDIWIKEGYNSKEHNKETFEKAKVLLEKYLQSDLHKESKPIHLEKTFSFWIDKSLKMIGKIDRVDDRGKGVVEIIDYKTGGTIPSQRDIDKDLQMTIYAMAAVDKGILGKNIAEVKLSFYYFENQTKISTARTAADLEKAKGDILGIRKEIEESDFKCSHGIICQNCEFKILCNE